MEIIFNMIFFVADVVTGIIIPYPSFRRLSGSCYFFLSKKQLQFYGAHLLAFHFWLPIQSLNFLLLFYIVLIGLFEDLYACFFYVSATFEFVADFGADVAPVSFS